MEADPPATSGIQPRLREFDAFSAPYAGVCLALELIWASYP
jgi:hypothetical protein